MELYKNLDISLSLVPSGRSITSRVQWKLFSTNIKSYLGAFKTQQIYFFKRSLFACLRELHFIYSADINWYTGSSKTAYIHSKIHFCDTHTTDLVQSQGLFETLLMSQPLWLLLSLHHVLGLLATHPGSDLSLLAPYRLLCLFISLRCLENLRRPDQEVHSKVLASAPSHLPGFKKS